MVQRGTTMTAPGLAALALVALLAAGCTATASSAAPTTSDTMEGGAQSPSSWVQPPASIAIPLGSSPAPSPGAPLGVGPSAMPALPTTPAGTGAAQLTESSNGATIYVPAGSTVTLVLHNVYWSVHESSATTILALAGPPVYSGAGTISCIPGTGCGTVTATFRALAPGRAIVSASRVTCGEALQCVGGEGSFEVTIIVTP